MLVEEYLRIFEKYFEIYLDQNSYPIDELQNVLVHFKSKEVQPKLNEHALFGYVNRKFGFFKNEIKGLIDYFAIKKKIYFTFIEKRELANFINTGNIQILREKMIDRFNIDILDTEIFNENNNYSRKMLLENIRAFQNQGKVTKNDVAMTLLGAFVFSTFPVQQLQSLFLNADVNGNYIDILKSKFNLSRSNSLSIINIDDTTILEAKKRKMTLSNMLAHVIKTSYDDLDNFSHLAILVDSHISESEKWNIWSDSVLYAEKFRQVKETKGYFHPDKIKNQTKNYIKELESRKAQFSLSNEGFTYLDTYIIRNHSSNGLVILFEKNQKDERVIPCPICYSTNVRGNSYPKINVKSWECSNPLCPGRSKSNRGHRFSLNSEIMQIATTNKKNIISDSDLKKWKLDYVEEKSITDVIKMIIQRYSLINDVVVTYNLFTEDKKILDRKIVSKTTLFTEITNDFDKFECSSFFKRFVYKSEKRTTEHENKIKYQDDYLTMINGDSTEVMASMLENSIDSAVTSPPYYNAREYAQWENIYTYLYDMYNNALQVYHILKPGGIYLFNIFDYFDNENTIAFSAMGKKRMILGAYIINIFRRIGFKLNENIIWFKGEIQGNRAFNQGNPFPFYQAPLNTWEHIFVFSKGKNQLKFDSVLKEPPVKKMVRGRNILGHTAPFPEHVPELLIRRLKHNQVIIDPYVGSGTTNIVAHRYLINSIGIERSKQYYQLAIRRYQMESENFKLF
ncbi:DNA-methyltransferase [Lactiplantibacillus plantarum]|uniref:DNA-methyltransferase n=1 Tax=Lactiplantibacillus plantarum TaxID=1590 RepID=UPI0009B5C095|nr:site-specific DNA-methyltransferase [Lactiplantibacillus plantarum]